MKSTMENLYYSNISPYAQSMQRGSETDMTLKRIVEYEEALSSRLNDEEKELFEKFDDAKAKLMALTACEHWTQGFSLGLRIGMEAAETVDLLAG